MDSTNNARNPVEELAEEFMRRRRNRENPTVDEYVADYPELADEIRELFPTLAMMEHVRDNVIEDDLPPTDRGSSHVGRQVGDYRVMREIGRGGMGVVYEAQQMSLDRRVAMKVLAPHLVRSARYLDRFRREARAAASLQHANIVPVFGVGSENGTHFYVMQYIHGRGMDEVLDALPNADPRIDFRKSGFRERSALGLATALQTGAFRAFEPDSSSSSSFDLPSSDARRFDAITVAHGSLTETPALAQEATSSLATADNYVERIARLAAQVADAIAFAHERGVLHRDIKPSNLLFDVFGSVWVTDFGLAKVDGEEDLTQTGDILGTLRYISPESIRGESDGRSDVYGLGLTLYELLARQRAFDGRERGELLRQISEVGPPPLSRHVADVPADLETVIHKAIAIDPKDRYRSAREFCDDLLRFLRHEPVHARRISAFERIARWSSRNRGISRLLGVVAVLIILGLAGSLTSAVRMARLAEERQRESDQALKRLVEASISNAERIADSGRAGQRTQGLTAVAEAVPIARKLEMGEETLRRLRNAAINSLARPDFAPVKEWPVDASTVFLADVDASFQHYALQRFVSDPVSIFRIADHQEVASISVPLPLLHLRLSHDSQYLAAVSGPVRSQSLSVFQLSSGKLLIRRRVRDGRRDFRLGNATSRIALAPGEGHLVEVIELPELEVRHAFRGSTRVTGLAFGPKDEQLVVCRSGMAPASPVAKSLDDVTSRIWPDIRNLIPPPSVRVHALAEQGDGNEPMLEFPLSRVAHGASLSHNGLLAALQSDGISVFDVARRTRICSFEKATSDVHIHFDPSGELIATHGTGGNLTTFWNARSGLRVLSFNSQAIGMRGTMFAYQASDRIGVGKIVPSREFLGLSGAKTGRPGACHPGNRVFIQPDGESGLRIWDLHNRRPLAHVGDFFCWGAQFTPDGRFLYTSLSPDVRGVRALYRWPFRPMAGDPSHRWQLGPPKKVPLPEGAHPHHLVINKSGDRLAFDDPSTCRIVVLSLDERGTSTQPVIMRGPAALMFVDISPDGRWAASGTWHGTNVAIYDLQTARMVKEFPTGRTWVRFSPDSKYLLCGAGQRIELATWTKTPLPDQQSLQFIAPHFAADGRMGVFHRRARDARFTLIDTSAWKPLARLTSGSKLDIAECRGVTPDGQKVIIKVGPGALAVWDLRAVREQLAEMDLDWDLPPFKTTTQDPIHLTVDVGSLK